MGNREYACSITVFLAASFAVVSSAVARQASEDPASVESNPARYVPARTEWGDPDLRGTWPIHRVAEAKIPLQRPEKFGDRAWLSEEEFAERLEEARKADASYANEVEASGTLGLAEWLQSTPFGRRASLIVSPANGRLPPMTPRGRDLFDAGRISENVAYSTTQPNLAGAIVDGWLRSEHHREAILGPYSSTGIAVSRSRDGRYFITQIFVAEKGDEQGELM